MYAHTLQTIQNHFKRLPEALLQRIIEVSYNGSEDTYIAKFLLRQLRLCSTAFWNATDVSRSAISLRPDQLTSQTKYLSKLAGLKSVVIRVSINQHAVLDDLSLLTTTAPRVAALSLLTGCNVVMQVVGVVSMLLPWQNSLMHLVMEKCSLISSVGSDMGKPTEATQAWTPGFPCLQTLCLKEVNVNFLDMSECPALHELNLTDNVKLTSLDVRACEGLLKLVCDSSPVPEFDLSQCPALTDIYICSNSSMTALDVSGCESLKTLFCCKSASMTVLRVTGCSMLDVLSVRQGVLQELDVSSCTALTYLDCTFNPSLAALNIENCKGLRMLRYHGCRLDDMDISSHPDMCIGW